MYRQVLDPVSHSLGLTSIFAILPLVVLFVLLGVVLVLIMAVIVLLQSTSVLSWMVP